MTEPPLRVGIVAGEASGDILGARLMGAIRARRPDARFAGVGGERMLAQGLDGLAPLEALSVNGFKDPLLRLPSLLRLLRALRRRFTGADGRGERANVVVGVDFNVFNLMLERAVKERGIPTAHYVSPSVYFWRPGRVERVKRAADAVLALFPFEPALYEARGAKAIFVGHPLADDIGLCDGDDAARRRARAQLDLPPTRRVVALLPGSRRSEIRFLGAVFLQAARLLRDSFADPVFLIPTPSAEVDDAVRTLLGEGDAAALDVRIARGCSRTAIAAADAVLVKSGTATLETMLLRRPMVVSYRMGALTAWLIRRMKKTDHVALPNILAGRPLVPELLQEQAQPALLAQALVEQHERCRPDSDYLRACAYWHRRLRQGAADRAAAAVLALVDAGRPEQQPHRSVEFPDDRAGARKGRVNAIERG